MKVDFDPVQYKPLHAPAGGEERSVESRQGIQNIHHGSGDDALSSGELQQLRSELQRRRLTEKSPWRRKLARWFRWLR